MTQRKGRVYDLPRNVCPDRDSVTATNLHRSTLKVSYVSPFGLFSLTTMMTSIIPTKKGGGVYFVGETNVDFFGGALGFPLTGTLVAT